MLRYIVRRLFHMVPLLFGVTLISFIVIHLSPGDFLAEIRLNPVVDPAVVEEMRRNLGLDQPVHIQYLKWLWSVLHFDFGYSFAYHVPVSWLLGSRLLNTLILNLGALVLAWLIAIPIGIHAATRQYSWSDNALSMVAYLGISTPTFFSGLLLLYLAFVTGWLPIGGMTSIEYDTLPWYGKVLDVARHMLVPATVLAFGAAAGLMRQMRANLLEVLRQDYVRTARAKGLADRPVTYKHAVRNAINPLITIFGFEIGALLSGSAILENVVGWPGLGQLILESVVRKDLYVVMGALLLGSVTLILGNLIADLLLAVADPRIRYD
ncbi:MAG: ABC transporter permease [Armatimonadota bacterium]|nr:ABC transporter permease [Armatimonadota bacterium]MDR7448091.1 ABC transporter permease [Armatimonadota bacterium]MDR7459705.1 ABC transporter permease [Armatimonadota bacterium]MDR7478297.1 ABC transporter permease [Armatimonadota bacterium]MDR7487260.1 ABC transporter permease [Armatimonadota bacterium]